MGIHSSLASTKCTIYYMNDWDVIWHYELLRIGASENQYSDFGFDRLSNLANNYLFEFRSKSILDATCSIGHTTNFLKERGYNVFGSDASEVAITAARVFNKNIPFFVSKWENIPLTIDLKFDVIYNDCILWTSVKDDLVSSIKGIFDALLPQGQFIFLGINTQTDKIELRKKMHNRYNTRPKVELAWKIRHNENEIQCTLNRSIFDDYIEVQFNYTTLNGNRITKKETATLKEVYKWTYQEIRMIIEDIGFCRLETIKLFQDEFIIAYKE